MLAAVGIFTYLVGRWQARLGIRRLMTAGGIICGFSLLVVLSPAGLFQLYVWGFLNGVSSSLVIITTLTTVSDVAPDPQGPCGQALSTWPSPFPRPFCHRSLPIMLETLGYQAVVLATAAAALIVTVVAAQFTDPPEAQTSGPTVEKQPEKQVIAEKRSLSIRESLGTRSFWFLWVTWGLKGAAGIAMVTLAPAFGPFPGPAPGFGRVYPDPRSI